MDTTRSRLSELADVAGFRVIRDCMFTYAGKILSPIDDLVVPLVKAEAAADLTARDGISGVIATPGLADLVPSGIGLAVADEPMAALHRLHAALHAEPGRLWTDFPTSIDPSAIVHPGAVVAERNVRIGPGAEILPTAYVAERVVVGSGSRVHAGAVVGADAYELIMLDGRQTLRPQSGGVRLEENVEVLSGAVVTRAAFGGATCLGDRAVLDANVTVSHDARIGRDVRVGGGSWIGGRVVIGDLAALGPGCVVSNGVRIGERARVSMGAVVSRDVADEAHVTGNFALPHDRFLAHLRSIR
jgi:UDP-3-O-[3-hydroxymyristoyl] glucosamine N-acyltransferase